MSLRDVSETLHISQGGFRDIKSASLEEFFYKKFNPSLFFLLILWPWTRFRTFQTLLTFFNTLSTLNSCQIQPKKNIMFLVFFFLQIQLQIQPKIKKKSSVEFQLK